MEKNTKAFRIICLFVGLIMIISILPYLYLATKAIPLGDDYIHTTITASIWQSTGSILRTILSAVEYTKSVYLNWQGSISGVFLNAMGPMVFSLKTYRISMLLLNLFYILSIAFVAKYFLCDKFKIKPYITFVITSALLASFYHVTPDAFQAFFWSNGSVYYLFTFCITMFFYIAVTKMYSGQNRLIISIIFALFIGLNNLPNALMTICTLLFLTLLSLINNKENKYKMIFISLFIIGAFLINILAPGNKIRMEKESTASIGIVAAMIKSFISSAKDLCVLNLKLNITVPVLLIFTPIIYKNMSNELKYINPILLLVISFLLYTSHYPPTIYVSDSGYYGRVENIRYLMSQIFYIINYVNLLGYLNKSEIIGKLSEKTSIRIEKVIYLALVVFAFGILALLSRHAYYNDITLTQLVKQTKGNQISTFVDQSEQRIEIMQNESLEYVILEPLTYKKTLLGFDNLTDDADNPNNLAVSVYYNKTIVVK